MPLPLPDNVPQSLRQTTAISDHIPPSIGLHRRELASSRAARPLGTKDKEAAHKEGGSLEKERAS